MDRRRALGLVLAAALLLGACSDDGGGDDGSPSESPTTEAAGETTTTAVPEAVASTFEERDCWWEAELPEGVTLTCGTVEVPSDASDPDSDPVVLAVARASHAEADPEAPPVLLLHGGPGGSALATPLSLGDGSLVRERDLITFDQRGSGHSTPSLDCPEKEEAVLAALGAAGTWEEEYATNRAAVEECHRRLTEDEGIDLDLYDTPASVHDMEVLRETFGLEQWDVWGGSYGSRLGLAYAREHPDRVRSLLIDSVYPPEVGGVERELERTSEAIDRLVAECDADAACAGLGGLGSLLDEAVAALDADPEEVTTTVTVSGEEVERDFVVTGSDVLSGMFAALYDTSLIPAIPGIVDGLAAGDRSIVPTYLAVGVPRLTDLSEGAYYSIDCADSAGALDEDDAAERLTADRSEDALVALSSAGTFCDVWPVERLPSSFTEPALPDVPTLVYGGTLDPITPVDDSRAQAEAMPDARYVEVPRGGHGVAGFDDCTREARAAFWTDPTSDLPACVADIVGPPFSVEAG